MTFLSFVLIIPGAVSTNHRSMADTAAQKGREAMPSGFPPIAAPDARVLILGTMPSEASLQKQQYYGYGRNAFWPILYALWDEPFEEDYEKRCRF